MRMASKHWEVEALPNGLIRFSAGGVVLSDRGALHEVLDMTVRPGGTNEARDDHREVHHFLGGLHEDVERHVEKGRITIRGEARTAGGRGDTQWYETVLEVDRDPRFLRLTVQGKYLRALPRSGDDSICFLSPGGFALDFGVGSQAARYIGTRSDGEVWANLDSPGLWEASEIPRRLRVGIDEHGWGSITNGQGQGFILIVESFSSTDPKFTHGEIRVTRPRPPAEKKFDEVELQWMPGGTREAGSVERAVLLLAPCANPEDAHRLYTTRIIGDTP